MCLVSYQLERIVSVTFEVDGQDMLPRSREQHNKLTEGENQEAIYITLSPDQNHSHQQDSSQSFNSTCFTTASLNMSSDESIMFHDGEFSKLNFEIPESVRGDENGNIAISDFMDKSQQPDQDKVFTNTLATDSSDAFTDAQDSNSQASVSEIRPNKPNLMALLSGKQTSKKSKSKVRTNEDKGQNQNEIQEPRKEEEFEHDEDISINECINDSFTESKSNDLRKEHEMLELEKKFYNDNIKSVTAKDFLAKLNQKTLQDKNKDTENVEETPICINDEGDREPVLIEIDSDENKDEIELLESKVFSGNLKRTSARDIFHSFRPLPTLLNKHKAANVNNRSYTVSFRMNPTSLKEIQMSSNPFFTKGNKQTASLPGAKSVFETLMQNPSSKKKKLVTLRVEPNKLREVTKPLNNPLFSRGTVGVKGKSANSFFKSMMENASGSTHKLSTLQKLKELYPPSISREQLHVYDKNDTPNPNAKRLMGLVLKSEHKPYSNLDQDTKEEDISTILNPPQIDTTPHKYKVEIESYSSKEKLLESICKDIPLMQLYPPLMNIYNRYLDTSIDWNNKESLLWTSLFQPHRMSDVLISSTKQNDIKTWVLNSFARLKSQTLKTPRNVLLKQQKRQRKNVYSGIDGFVVDDYGDYFQDGSETEEDVFVPLLIIHGSTGSCKSSSVYAAINEINGYVYEINSGQPRGKKDILGTLKEMCTTHLVHRQNEEKQFQKGIILLEDCDILFEQDKNFWLAVHEVLNISRRPLIITCNDLTAIPQSIIEFANDEDAIINLDENDHDTVANFKNYLLLCCISQGFQIDAPILENILKDCYNGSYDLRKALMSCQIFCQNYAIDILGETNHEIYIRKIKYNSFNETKNNDTEYSLDELTDNIDLLSVSDVISSNSHSLMEHESIPNELLDIYFIDESTKLRQRTLPHELNIGDFILEANLIEDRPSVNMSSFNKIREATTAFTASRSKELPKFVQDLYSARSVRASTRSMTDSTESLTDWQRDITGVSDSSICNYLSPLPYILELAPFARQWCRYQNSLDIVEEDTLENLGVSVKKFIGWRQFQDNSKQVLNTFI
jgi:telomere length regulation protein